MNNAEPLLVARGLSKYFKVAGGKLSVLADLDFDLAAGTICYIVGRSGAGKTTLLHLLGGLDRPDGGSVRCQGQDLATLSEAKLARFRNRHLGFVFQFYHLLPELTLLENLLLPVRISGGPLKDATDRARGLLRDVDLVNRDGHHPAELSGGEQQRAAMARSLMNEPDLVLCDEPTGNLDRANAERMMALIKRLNQTRGQTFCIVTHEEFFVKNEPHAFRLENGKLTYSGNVTMGERIKKWVRPDVHKSASKKGD